MSGIRVIFVGTPDGYRVDVVVDGEARTLFSGNDMNAIADSAMDLRNDLALALELWGDTVFEVVVNFADSELVVEVIDRAKELAREVVQRRRRLGGQPIGYRIVQPEA
jgi:hypothetical protein